MSVISEIYQIMLTYKDYQIITLPQTPEKITVSNEDNTIVETMVNGMPFTIPQRDGPKTYKFDFSITNKAYPHTFQTELKEARFYIDLFETLKRDQETLGLSILRTGGRHNTNVEVILTDYSYTEDADDLSDFTFSVTFMEYFGQKNMEKPLEAISHLEAFENSSLLTAGNAVSWTYRDTQYIRSYNYLRDQNVKENEYIDERLQRRGV